MIREVLKKNRLCFISIAILIVLFLIIKNIDVYNKIISFDYKVISFIESFQNNGTTKIMKIFTCLGEWYTPITIIVFMFIFIKNKLSSELIAVNYVFSALVALITKLLILRPRPSLALIKIPKTFSFPSGHTLTGIVFYILLGYILTYKKDKTTKVFVIIFFALISLLIAFSRIYLGVHYFSDVVGGLLLSIPCLIIGVNILNRFLEEK